MKKDITIQTILDKVEELNKKRKLQGLKPYCFGPVLKEKEIKQFEEKYEISLPTDYRNFLLQAGNGNNVEALTNSSSQYALSSLDGISADFNYEIDLINSKEPFPFSNEATKEIIFLNHYYQKYPWQYVENIYSHEAPIKGCIILNYAGWSTCHTALVVTGEQKGKIWYVADAYIPVYSNDSLECMDFLEWLDDYIEALLNPLDEQVLKTPEKVKSLTFMPLTMRGKVSWKDILACTNLERIDFGMIDMAPQWKDIHQFGKLKEITVSNSGNKKEYLVEELPEALLGCKELELVYFSYNSLKVVPEWIGEFKQLKMLDLYWNLGLKSISSSIKNLKELLYLNIAKTHISPEEEMKIAGYFLEHKNFWFNSNKYQYILNNQKSPVELCFVVQQQSDFDLLDSFKDLAAVKRLFVTVKGENIFLPERVGDMINLQSIKIEKGVINNLKETLGSLLNLNELFLYDSDRMDIKEVISLYTHLKTVRELTLYIDGTIPDTIKELKHIRRLTLYVRHKNLVVLSGVINTLTSLQSFTISNAREIIFPESFDGLTLLNKLRIENIEKIVLPDSFRQSKIKNIYIQFSVDAENNSIASFCNLPIDLIELEVDAPALDGSFFFSEISHCTNLEYLSVSTREIGQGIGCLKNLKTLIIDNDEELNKTPLKISGEIASLKSLETLHLEDNHLSELPDCLWELTQLKKLDLSNNHLQSISHNISQLKKLEYLNLSINKFNAFPGEITFLETLNYLDLSNNQLVSLSKDITRLQNLEILYLHDNKIKEFPDYLSKLKKISQLIIDKGVNVNKKIEKNSFLHIDYFE